MPAFSIGDPVSKVGGDYRFDGEVRGVITKLSGAIRYVVEDDRGVLHIFSEKQMALRRPPAPELSLIHPAPAYPPLSERDERWR